MGLWLETIWIVLVALCGLLAGWWASRHSDTARISAMALAFAIIGLILLSRQSALWNLIPPLRPIAAGRLRFILLTFAVTIGLTTPLSRLRSIISRFVTCVMMSIFIAILITLPFMGPALIQRDLSDIPTRFDVDGVCRQSQSFTCGPAAAVTALQYFGFEAAEGPLAIAARTSPIIGTSPWNLYRAVKSAYAETGLRCSFRYLDSLEAVPPDSVVLVVVKDAMLTDHCVAVMGYTDQMVTIADPMEGLINVPRTEFARQWRRCGIILQRPL
jgi:predicted double-glycine peptidase